MGIQKNGCTLLAVIILCLLPIIPEAQKFQTFSQEYGDPFGEDDFNIFEVIGQATISNTAFQVTPDSASSDFTLYNQSGRILLKKPFRLWEGDIASNETVASFTSEFVFNIYKVQNDTPGEGLAFVISPDLEIPGNSYGQYLGLTNATTDGNSSNRFVAIEFDTYQQSFDPDANHLGLNINSVRSVKTTSLSPLGIELASFNRTEFYNVWVEYDGVNKVLEVYMRDANDFRRRRPSSPPILTSYLDLKSTVNQYSYFGFAASTGIAMQLNAVLRWNLTVRYFTEPKNSRLEIVLKAGIPVLGLLMLLGAAGLGYYIHKKRTSSSASNILGTLKNLPGTPREFRYRDLRKATNKFDHKNKLGQGGFGVVYKGILAKENNMEIAVKCFSRESIKGQYDFLAELTIINRLRHKNLVKLLGWCYKKGKLLLVYEYMPNGSLDKHLFSRPPEEPLSWNLRYKILQGVASALHYLHNEYEVKVIHRDLKASNIMVDADFNACLGDFGLARALDKERTSYAGTEGVLGTMGYIAPECFHTAKATEQSDVYAFGAVLLEVVSGKRQLNKIGSFYLLVDWVWSLHRDGHILDAVDQRIMGNYDPEEAERLLLLGLACSHPIASERPRTQNILQLISGSAPVPEVPPFKPAFVWPASLPNDFDSKPVTTSITSSHCSQYNSGWTSPHVTSDDPDQSLVSRLSEC